MGLTSGTISEMKQHNWFWLRLGLGILLFMAGACQPEVPAALPSATPDAAALRQTAAALVTQAAQQTETALALLPPTATPLPSDTPAPTVIPTLARSQTPAPSQTLPGVCNQVSAGTPFDLTIPDGTALLAGQGFTKTWRMVNSGTCKWTRLYQLVFFSGNSMGAHQENYLPVEVEPGAAVDLSVNFVAPQELGVYQSNWMLRAPDGTLFGLGRNADGPFWVKIVVVETFTPTATGQ